jgi:5-(aminomethyl)-3-furanmethanol phosphate kinase
MVIVVKVGGSLAADPQKLKTLCTQLEELAKKYPLIIVPGGGEFADCVRSLDKRFSLSAKATHRMAILGMDQYGLLLADLVAGSYVVDSLETASKTVLGRLTVFLPSKLMLSEDRLENSWDVTSDSITVYIADRLGADKVLLVTDVDGVFTSDPKTHPDAKLLPEVAVRDLLALNQKTSIDRYLPKILEKTGLECVVVNGLFPERLESILAGKNAICTLVTC